MADSIPLARRVERTPETQWFPGLVTLRAVATLLVVLLHAAVPYTLRPLPGLPWPTHDPQPSPLVDVVFWWIQGFIMPLFFTLSGFLAMQALERRGPREFLSQRIRRLLGPLLFGLVVVLPIDLYVWMCGWVAEARIEPVKLRSLKLEGADAELWGLSHLWFLQYLFLYCIALAIVWERLRVSRIEPMPLRLLGLLIGVPCGLLIGIAPEIVVGFQHSFWPVPTKFLHGALFFIAGASLQRRPPLARRCAEHSRWLIAVSLPVLGGILPWIHQHLADPVSGPDRLLLAAGLALFAVLSTFGWFGLFLRPELSSRPWLTSLAEASFWVYLVHHPLVGLLHIDLKLVPVPAGARFLVAAAVPIALTLAAYHTCVRPTWLGSWLNGSRRSEPRIPDPVPVDHRRAA